MAQVTMEQSSKIYLLDLKSGDTFMEIAEALAKMPHEILAEDLEVRLDCHGE